MIDALILPLQHRLLAPAGERLARAGIRADTISIAGFAVGLAGVVAIACGYQLLALPLIAANRLMDGLDGAVARVAGPTDRGAFLDIALDFLFYALVPIGFAVQLPQENALPAAVLIASFVGTGSSFLAFAAIAERRGLSTSAFPAKGLYFLGGLTEGFETIFLFFLMCLLPHWFAPLAYIFAVACALTTLLRWHRGWVAFGPDRQSDQCMGKADISRAGARADKRACASPKTAPPHP